MLDTSKQKPLTFQGLEISNKKTNMRIYIYIYTIKFVIKSNIYMSCFDGHSHLDQHIKKAGVKLLKVTYYTTKPFRKSASSDITSGRVHLDVCWIDQWTAANVAHLSVTLSPLGMSEEERRFSKRLVTAIPPSGITCKP